MFYVIELYRNSILLQFCQLIVHGFDPTIDNYENFSQRCYVFEASVSGTALNKLQLITYGWYLWPDLALHSLKTHPNIPFVDFVQMYILYIFVCRMCMWMDFRLFFLTCNTLFLKIIINSSDMTVVLTKLIVTYCKKMYATWCLCTLMFHLKEKISINWKNIWLWTALEISLVLMLG